MNTTIKTAAGFRKTLKTEHGLTNRDVSIVCNKKGLITYIDIFINTQKARAVSKEINALLNASHECGSVCTRASLYGKFY